MTRPRARREEADLRPGIHRSSSRSSSSARRGQTLDAYRFVSFTRVVQECTTFTLSAPIQLERYIHAPPCTYCTYTHPLEPRVRTHTVPTAVGRPDAFPRVRASASLDRGRSTPRDGTRRGASTDDRSRTPAVVVGARRTPRTRSIGRAKGGARARTSSSAKRNNLTARASGLSARARGEERRARGTAR